MRKIVAVVSLTLDGVMQAPGRKDEDPRGGFQHGGWAGPYFDPVMLETMGEGMSQGAPTALRPPDLRGLPQGLARRERTTRSRRCSTKAQKYVASRTLREPLPWQNSTLLRGEAAETVARLKQEPGKDVVVLGSGELLQALMRHGLVDQFVLSIHPLVLGPGRRLFDPGGERREYRLVRSVPTTTGVVIATYEPARA